MKLKILISFVLMCLSVSFTAAQNPQWELSKDKNIIQQNLYLPQYNLWLPGSTGRSHNSEINPLMRSYGTDSLFLWQYVQTQVDFYFTDIFFYDSLYGWVSHGNSGILKTTDSGFNWDTVTLIHSGIYSINGVYFLDRNTGWAVGNSGTIRKTTNGGIDWINQDWEQSAQYYSVHFFDSNTGIVAGLKPYYAPPHGYIIKTTNSGNNWQEAYVSTDTILSSYTLRRQFWLNNDTGWICGDNLLLKTTDCGLTYSNYYSHVPPTQNGYNIFNDIYFINDSIGWIASVGDNRNIYKTTNAGINWFFQDNPVAYYSYPQINGIIFTNSNTGWASSYVGLIIVTTNGGSNWMVDKYANYETSKFANYNSKIWLGAELGRIYYTNSNEPIGIINNSNEYPNTFQLFQNYPNPFNPKTIIEYALPKSSNIKIIIYDVLGNEVVNLVNQKQSPGKYKTTWDASNNASGVYFYTLIYDEGSITKKLVLVK
jgi:photosystem II stability/assembly factor-like uncharacterized protein